jgi:hypothetical protein
MNWRPIFFWCSEAGTVFVNGFLSGLAAGGTGGGIAGATTTDRESALWTFLAITAANAGKHVLLWHHNGHPFPNPFPRPQPPEQPITTISL